MDNHYHALVCTPRGNLSAAMQWLNMAYSVWLNKRRERPGINVESRDVTPMDSRGNLSAAMQWLNMSVQRVAQQAARAAGHKCRKSRRDPNGLEIRDEKLDFWWYHPRLRAVVSDTTVFDMNKKPY